MGVCMQGCDWECACRVVFVGGAEMTFSAVGGVWGHPSSGLCCCMLCVNTAQRPDFKESCTWESLQLLNREP